LITHKPKNEAGILVEKQGGNKILITGAAGFIGSHFAELMALANYDIVVLDALTYAGRLENLAAVESRIEFVHANLNDFEVLQELFHRHKFSGVINFAAETHVDRSIENAVPFLDSNVAGVLSLLRATLSFWQTLAFDLRKAFRYIQVSTDEVFGSLGPTGLFDESSPYSPNSPYSASKAAGDHFVQSFYHTHELPTLIVHLPNSFGPRQFHEKLIPRIIRQAVSGGPLPVYGNGQNVRDWLPVIEAASAVKLVFEKGNSGEHYCFSGHCEKTNIEVVTLICSILDRISPKECGTYLDQISFVSDRKGHDWRYAMSDSKAVKQLGFSSSNADFEVELSKTIVWYLNNDSQGLPTIEARRD
jgi:dTDP-glucose 4,6-dehydratase